MSADLFISYAWTSDSHRSWVRMLASQLHLIGFNVILDEEVDYGESLHGFMRQVVEAKHVLLIVDENYVDRADNLPASGVGIETKWMSEVFSNKPSTWLSVIFVQNPNRLLPDWLTTYKPMGFDFNCDPEKNEFPGSLQLEDVWRWVEGLPPCKAHTVPLSVVRKRAARLERIDVRRDPARYVNPSLSGSVTFRYNDNANYTVGYGDYSFKIKFSGCNSNSVYVYTDGSLKAIGLITDPGYDRLEVESFLTLGRTVSPVVGQSVVLLNLQGNFCVISISEVQREVNEENYIPEHVAFTYQVLMDE
ncbi:toll/interleukin-1 receptor domain-containing protein [Pseudomonas fontis]|uniref:Toll/interleukin-1 receptor domain-containing protein n=1 Tax=Pseudomonas fontis TaxID=2942633 RepID=A0ABT5NTD2_9PSED|nr:toll/interleukin-1 receptor domain-containing protein [Pseudomonas fontis]MDD0976911.1 toll/interleukin-1 receptor domain-containing protein [Pseudomonas fontis]MDD0991440.1 toll/interleukin-1 receptor domain-containing protein [Pseudomonas fontis]